MRCCIMLKKLNLVPFGSDVDYVESLCVTIHDGRDQLKIYLVKLQYCEDYCFSFRLGCMPST
jgi:hypothetical protein